MNRLNFIDDGMGRALKAPKIIGEDGLGMVKKMRKKKKKKPKVEPPSVPPPGYHPHESIGLESFDFLQDKNRGKFCNTDPKAVKFFSEINHLSSKRRKKNRHLPRTRNKNERKKLTADVVALESALQLISRYGDKYRSGPQA